MLFSGGKDSVRTAEIVKKEGEVAVLLNLRSRNPDSYMFHTPASSLTAVQAEAMGMPYLWYETEGVKEAEVEDLKKAVMHAAVLYRADTIAAGALRSTYQYTRLESIAHETGLNLFAPLWHIDSYEHLLSLITSGYKVMFTAVASDGLEKGWLGKVLNHEALRQLVSLKNLNIDGEGGEYETCVLDAPHFTKEIEIMETEEIWRGLNGRLEVKRWRLKDKTQ